MRIFRSALLVGACSAIVAGAALAGAAHTHMMKVSLPDGTVEQIRYTGDVAPKVVVVPTAAPIAFFDDEASPFAMFDRITARMDAETDAMLRRVSGVGAGMPGPGAPLDLAAMKSLPAGTVSYSFVSTTTGSGTCTQSVQLTSMGSDQQPKLVSQTSGDCAKASTTKPMTTAAPAPAEQPKLFKTKLEAPEKSAPKREAL